jgi:hypothetical protein
VFFLDKKRGRDGSLVFFIKGGSGFCSGKPVKIRLCGFERIMGGVGELNLLEI